MSDHSTTFMPFSFKPFELRTLSGHAYRSHSVHQNVQNCIESTYIGGAKSYHIGFSPVSSERVFVSLLRRNSRELVIYQRIDPNSKDGERYNKTITKEIEAGESFMICLDSLNQNFIIKHSDVIYVYNYERFQQFEEWYVYFDAGSQATKNKNQVLVNLGTTKFNYTLPEGFYPWHYDISAIRGLPKQPSPIFFKVHPLSYTLIYLFINQ